MYAPNYYSLLMLSPADSSAAVQAGYHDLARMIDHGIGLGPLRHVQECSDACSVLSDPHERQFYENQLRSVEAVQPEELSPASSNSILSEPACVHPSCEALRDRLLRNFTQSGIPKAEHSESLTVEVLVEPEAYSISVEIPVVEICPTCRGMRHVELFTCHECDGAGFLERTVTIHHRLDGRAVAERSLSPIGIDNCYLRLQFLQTAA